jgi:hypothetical protein
VECVGRNPGRSLAKGSLLDQGHHSQLLVDQVSPPSSRASVPQYGFLKRSIVVSGEIQHRTSDFTRGLSLDQGLEFSGGVLPSVSANSSRCLKFCLLRPRAMIWVLVQPIASNRSL